MSVSAGSPGAPRNLIGAGGRTFELARETGKFRLNRKSVGLTYSAPVDRDMPIQTNEEVLDALNEHAPDRYAIGREKHENGKYHFHVYLEWDKKIDIKNERAFDIKGVHPNIIVPKMNKAWRKYCTKEKDVLTNIEDSVWKRALEHDGTDQAAEDILWEEVPEQMMKYARNIVPNLKRRRYKAPEQVMYYGPWPKEWDVSHIDQKKYSVVIRGASGIGKTQWMRQQLRDQDYLYVKGSLQGLKNYAGQHTIVFDDITIHGDDVMKYNALMDVESGGAVRVLYGTADIGAGVKRFFLTNAVEEGGLKIPDIPAIRRRYKEVHFPGCGEEEEMDASGGPPGAPAASFFI